jgi:hypothetical protein
MKPPNEVASIEGQNEVDTGYNVLDLSDDAHHNEGLIISDVPAIIKRVGLVNQPIKNGTRKNAYNNTVRKGFQITIAIQRLCGI